MLFRSDLIEGPDLDAAPAPARAQAAGQAQAQAYDPADEVLLNESVGLALLVVLDTLAPAERLAFVLHDVFAVPYAEIAPLVDRSVPATKMLASRARHRVRDGGGAELDSGTRRDQHTVVRAFLAASRGGDFDALLALLAPDAVVRADRAAREAGAPADLDGAAAVARQFCGRARGVRPALIDGAAGAVWAPGGKVAGAFCFTVAGGRILAIELIADPEHIAGLNVTILAADGAGGGAGPGRVANARD